MSQRQLEFVTFVIGGLAERLKRPKNEVYNVLNKHSVISSYLVPGYDVLHTFSSEYILDDVIDYMNDKGIKL